MPIPTDRSLTDTALDLLSRVTAMALDAEPVDGKLVRLLNEARACLGRGPVDPPHARPSTDGNFTVATFFLFTPDRTELAIYLPQNFPPEQATLRIPAGYGHPGLVASTGEGLLLEDTRQHEGFVQILKTGRMGSAMFSPLRWAGEILGAMVNAAIQPGTYTRQDSRVHGILANLAALLLGVRGSYPIGR